MRVVRAAWVVVIVAGGCGFEIAATTDGGGTGDTGGCAARWYDLQWHGRAPITIDATKVTGALDDVPVLIDQTLHGGRDGGADLVFTDDDGTTRLPHELESYDPSTGHLVAWVKLPHLTDTSGDRHLYVYYGNAAAPVPTDQASVWSSGYSAVWHMSGSPTAAPPQMLDSTGHGLGATVRGLPTLPTQVPGQIGGSVALDGINDGLDVPSNVVGPTFTYEAWIRQTGNISWHCIINNTPSYDRWFGAYSDNLDFWDGSAEHRVNAMVPLTAWTHVMATYDGAVLRMYRNGLQVDSPVTIAFPVRTSTMQLGYTNSAVGEWFAGQLDELRVSSVARTPGYAITTYRNQSAPAAFASIGAPEACP